MNGTVHLYEKETPHKYRKRNVFKIPDHTIVREYEKASDEVTLSIVKTSKFNCCILGDDGGQLYKHKPCSGPSDGQL